MTVSLPEQPCYFYECSNGRYRLTYFIPPETLAELHSKGEISAEAIDDFPDGVDLDCKEMDFSDLQAQYGYQPRWSAEEIHEAFYAIFSATKNWSKFRGSGLIQAQQIDSVAAEVTAKLQPLKAASAPTPPKATLSARRRNNKKQAARQAKIETTLKKMDLKVVEAKKEINEQSFAQVKMSEGENAHEIFSRLHLRQEKQ